MKPLLISTLLLFLTQFTWTQVYQTGDTIANFSATDVTKHREFELNKVEKNTIVLIFISNQCPFVEQYISRIKELDSTYSSVDFIFINTYSKTHLSENKHHMMNFLEKNQLDNIYLKEHSNQLNKLFGVEKAPEVYLLVRVNGTFKMAYKGAIDDNPQAKEDVNKYYLKDAIDSVLKNSIQTSPETRPMGCRVY
jgi:hypothetical protein